MATGHAALPIVRPLPEQVTPVEVFRALVGRPKCLWFDSSSGDLGFSGRYSFVTADPVRWFSANLGDPDPWPHVHRMVSELPSDRNPKLPPFQGGVAGLVGYEAATWLEPIHVARVDDLPTAAVAVGLYDWVIAFDHQTDRVWLISQGLGAGDRASRFDAAARRADQVESWLMRANGQTDSPAAMASGATEAHESPPPGDQFATRHRGVTSNFSSQGFRGAVEEIIRRIGCGDSFQINLAQRLLSRARTPAANLYLRLRDANPAPFAGYLDAGAFQVLSSSPEGFLKVRNGRVETRPIKGTAPRTGDAERDRQLAAQLAASEKDRAENVMIVDLMRNDLSRVCQDDSISVTQLCGVEQYQHVQHLVSVVEGDLRTGLSAIDLLRACFPGGSVTGAPKVEAMRTIAELEPHRRGPYCGSLGYVSCGGDADFNILIRTVTATAGYWQIPVGGGITARSDPHAEEAETWTKALGMLRAIGARP